MQEVDLPVVAISTELTEAIEILRKSQRAALLAEQQGEYHLFSAGSIVVGRSSGANTLFDLTPTKTVSLGVRPQERHALGVEVTIPDLRDRARRVVSDYVLSKVTSVTASLQIRDTDLALNYVSGPKDYYCDGPRHHHDFPPPDVSEGDPCPRGDGYHIVSSK